MLGPVYFICSGTFASGYVFKYFGYYGIFGSVAGIWLLLMIFYLLYIIWYFIIFKFYFNFNLIVISYLVHLFSVHFDYISNYWCKVIKMYEFFWKLLFTFFFPVHAFLFNFKLFFICFLTLFSLSSDKCSLCDVFYRRDKNISR